MAFVYNNIEPPTPYSNAIVVEATVGRNTLGFDPAWVFDGNGTLSSESANWKGAENVSAIGAAIGYGNQEIILSGIDTQAGVSFTIEQYKETREPLSNAAIPELLDEDGADLSVIDLAISDEFVFGTENGAHIMVVGNVKVRKPFRLEFSPRPLPSILSASVLEVLNLQDNPAYRQYIWVYDINSSLDNWNEAATNFVTCEIRHRFNWTPSDEAEVLYFGADPIEVITLFVYLEMPVDDFSELSNLNPVVPN
jgi:hypothetical protein